MCVHPDLLAAHEHGSAAESKCVVCLCVVQVVVATPRQLESLIRLSESLARMYLREEVTANDVQVGQRRRRLYTHRGT